MSTFLRWESTKSVRNRILCGHLGLFLGSDGHNCLFLIKVVVYTVVVFALMIIIYDDYYYLYYYYHYYLIGKIFITKPQLKSYFQSTCCYKKSNQFIKTLSAIPSLENKNNPIYNK